MQLFPKGGRCPNQSQSNVIMTEFDITIDRYLPKLLKTRKHIPGHDNKVKTDATVPQGWKVSSPCYVFDYSSSLFRRRFQINPQQCQDSEVRDRGPRS